MSPHTPKKPLVLSTKFLTDFCIHKGIKKNIAAFLDYLSKKGLNKTDADLFMLGCGVKETIFKSPQKVLFHGTTKKFSVLDLGPDEKIYATDNPDYAIFLGIIKLDRGGNAGVSMDNEKKTKLWVSDGFVNGASKFVSGYIHVVAMDNFKSCGNFEYTTKTKTPILFSIQVTALDLTVPVLVKFAKE